MLSDLLSQFLFYDESLKTVMISGICNIHFGEDDPAWKQAILPVKFGGLGIRSAVQLAYLDSQLLPLKSVSHIQRLHGR